MELCGGFHDIGSAFFLGLSVRNPVILPQSGILDAQLPEKCSYFRFPFYSGLHIANVSIQYVELVVGMKRSPILCCTIFRSVELEQRQWIIYGILPSIQIEYIPVLRPGIFDAPLLQAGK